MFAWSNLRPRENKKNKNKDEEEEEATVPCTGK
jgi:hypothetical protein